MIQKVVEISAPAVNGKSVGVSSLLDTDLYKLNMQCAVLQHFPDVEVEYTFHNRTAEMRLTHKAFDWLQKQIHGLEQLSLTEEEMQYLRDKCKHLHSDYLIFLQSLKLKPREQVSFVYHSVPDTNFIDLSIQIKGLWRETILYEIPVLSLVSEAYFKFVDTDWTHEDQAERAYEKAVRLLQAGCQFSEFGSRRRRDFETQKTVVQELSRAQQDYPDAPGRLIGTSNVLLAKEYELEPIGTVAHEWYMATAAITQDYEGANELGLRYWLDTFGRNSLSIALTDTFGTPSFFRDFRKPVGGFKKSATKLDNPPANRSKENATYADVYAGIRQDSGDPKVYVNMAATFYKSLGITGKKVLFSDSLNVEKCIDLKKYAEKHNLESSFGIGTFFSNDFQSKSHPQWKSQPLNIVMKVSKAAGNHCVKISDGLGKATGDADTIRNVRDRLGIEERMELGH